MRAPPSVFYNMIDLLEDYDKAIQGLDALLYKSGCFIYQFPSKSKISGATYDAIKTSNYILEQKSNGSVISIQKDADIKDFPLSNINGLIEAVNKLEDAITKALNDTPASILFDRQLSNGFSNGDKDKETEIQIVNTFRQNKIKPLYELTDYYVMLKAWNEDFINEIKEKYTDLSKYSNIQLFKKWQDDFVFEFGNLYPEPESITIENNSKKLDNLLKLQQLGANASDIEAELNEDRIFKNDIDLDGQPQQFDNNDNENNQIDYNLYKSIFGKSKKLTKYIDASAGRSLQNYIDRAIQTPFINDLLILADAKKEFDESKIKRDKDGRFAKKNENKDNTDNKGTDDKSNSDNSEITDNDRYNYVAKVYSKMRGRKDGYISDREAEAIRNNILSDKEKVKAIDNDIKYNRELEKNDKDKYNKYKEYKETAEYKEKMKQAINQFEGDTKATAEKLLPENLQAGELVLDKDGELDEAKINKLNPIEKGINLFTNYFENRYKTGFTAIKKNVKDLINKSIPKEISLYRYENLEDGKRYDFKVGKTIKMDTRSFCNSEDAFDSCRTLQLKGREPNEEVIFKIEGEVKSLDISSLSKFTAQQEHLVNGNFIITEIREATMTMPKIITIRAGA